MVEIIPLANVPVTAPLITPRLLEILGQGIQQGKKTLIFYNRRGNARAWICEDCGHFEKCPNCDIAFAYHTHPRKRLLCHHCNMTIECPDVCPNCAGSRIIGVGEGIQEIAKFLQESLPEARILIVDGDHKKKVHALFSDIDGSDIILATRMGALIQHPDIVSVVVLLFEANLSVPEYDLEEDLYSEIAYRKKQGIPLYIQTYIPDHPLLQLAVFGNFRDYLHSLTQERKLFSYPPYVDFVTIRVHHKEQSTVKQHIALLYDALVSANKGDTFIAADQDVWEKYRGEWSQKIILKGRGVVDMLESIETLIIRNRSMYVEWH